VRVAAISDIHGNLPALEAVLEEIDREGVDEIVVAGDSVSGPWPAEVFDLLESIGARTVHGNADRVDEVSAASAELAAWNEERLGARRRADAKRWPTTLELDVDGLGSVLVCHSTPRSDTPIYTSLTPDEVVVDVIGEVDADVVICGHTHMQYDRTLASGLRIVNPGSVGMPYEGRWGAFWAMLGPDVEFRCSDYDVEACVAAIQLLGSPADDQLVRYLLEPPSPDATTEYFESLRGT
jgi:putative phosphoesterase